MDKACGFLRLVYPPAKHDGIRTEGIIRVDSIVWVSYSLFTVFIQYRANDGSIITHNEDFDNEKTALRRFYMILKIMGAVGQIDISDYVSSANRAMKSWKEVE